VHQDLFVRLASEEGLPEFVYMAALQRTGAGTIALLGVPVAAANKLSEALIVESTLEIRAVIEVVEALFTLRVEYKSRDEARTKLETDIRALTTLLGHLGLTSEQRTMLEYHRAKMLPRLDRRDEARGKEEAISVFRALLEKDPMYATARNQLAKILPAPDSIAESEQVLRQHADKPGTVSWNVVLDSFRLLIRHGGDMAKHEGLLMSTIEYAKGIDLAEATRLVASVGQRAWFNAPHLLVPMLGALGSSEGAASSSEAFDGAQAHKYASIESEDSTARVALLKKSLRLYERASVTKEYERTHYAEALVLAGQHQKAIEVLSVVPTEKRSAFWLQRQANALNGLGSHAEALASIDLAIQTIPEPSLLAVFHRDRFRIRRAAGDEHAIEDLAIAIGLLPPGHPCRQRMEAEQQAVAASDA
jgi:tetratricopeptide (TPR) repeat protein